MMKKFLVLFGITFLMFGLAFNAHATSFDFLGSDLGGTASATVDFQGSGSNVFVITINNTSPTSLIDGTDWANAPAITGVGFDVDPNVEVVSWLLIDKDGVIGDWTMEVDANVGNIFLDLYPNNLTGGQAGLYNPATLTAPPGSPGADTIPWGGPPQYFTTAVLTIDFEGVTNLVVDTNSPFTRWQNVGADGEGSLKLSVPDPAAVFLLGSACLIGGLAGFRRKFRK